MFFVTIGHKDGCCKHEHENRDSAQECLVKWQNEKRRKNQTSDRIVLEVESIEELEEDLRIY